MMARHRTNVVTYNTYTFRGQDPVVGKIVGLIEASGATYTEINRVCGVTSGTLGNWAKGKTRMPKFATTNAVLRALGKQFVIADFKAPTSKLARRGRFVKRKK